jgi:hypothetical protein
MLRIFKKYPPSSFSFHKGNRQSAPLQDRPYWNNTPNPLITLRSLIPILSYEIYKAGEWALSPFKKKVIAFNFICQDTHTHHIFKVVS